MKTLIAVAVVALSALSFSAKASGSADNLIKAAQAYHNDAGRHFLQGYFSGMVQLYGDSTENCIPEGMKYGSITDRVARVIVYDPEVLSMQSSFAIMSYAVNKAYPCVKS